MKDLSLRKPHRPALPPNVPQAVVALIEACWAEDPADRPDFREISARIDEWQLEGIEEYWDEATHTRIKKPSFSSLSPDATKVSPTNKEVLHKVMHDTAYTDFGGAASRFVVSNSCQDP